MLLSLALLMSSFAHGGEWHSIGAMPAPPYFPAYTFRYECVFRQTDGRGRLTRERSEPFALTNADLQKSGFAEHVNEDGHRMTLKFVRGASEDQDGLQLSLTAELGAVSSWSTHDGTLAKVTGLHVVTRKGRTLWLAATCVRK